MSTQSFDNNKEAEKIISLFGVLSKEDKEKVLGELIGLLNKGGDKGGNIMNVRL